MPKYTLIYFNERRYGECIRMLLAYGGQEFEDKRVASWDTKEWAELKPKTPFASLPILEIDGKQYGQTNAICRYLGHKFGIAGANPKEDLEIDQAVQVLADLVHELQILHDIRLTAEKAPNEEDEARLSENVYPTLLPKLDAIVTKNNGHLALGKLTWADIVFAGLYDYLMLLLLMPDLDTKYPSFKKLVDNVITIPQVKKYLDNAPKTEH